MSQIRLPKITLHYGRCVIGPISNIAAHFLIPRFDTFLNGARGGEGPLDVLQYHSSTLSSSSSLSQISLWLWSRGLQNLPKISVGHLLEQWKWENKVGSECASVCYCKSSSGSTRKSLALKCQQLPITSECRCRNHMEAKRREEGDGMHIANLLVLSFSKLNCPPHVYFSYEHESQIRNMR